MTFAKTLKKHEHGRILIEALELTEKYCAAPRYEIEVVRMDEDGFGIVLDSVKCAKTTWRKAFKKAVEAWGER